MKKVVSFLRENPLFVVFALVAVVVRDPLTMLVSRIPRGANDVCTTRD